MSQNHDEDASSKSRGHDPPSQKSGWTNGLAGLLIFIIIGWLFNPKLVKSNKSDALPKGFSSVDQPLDSKSLSTTTVPVDVTSQAIKLKRASFSRRFFSCCKRWYPVIAILNVVITSLILFGIYDLFTKPRINLRQVGVLQFLYQPKQQTVTLKVEFTATNTSGKDGALQDPYGSLEPEPSLASYGIPFGPSDFTCTSDARAVSTAYIPVGKKSSIQVSCTATNVLGPISTNALLQPGARVFRLIFTGGDQRPKLEFCFPMLNGLIDQIKRDQLAEAHFQTTACR